MNSTNSKAYLVIGDIHSRGNQLENLLNKCGRDKQIILLGDILDGQQKEESEKTEADLKTLSLVTQIISSGGILLMGNHDLNLLTDCKSSKTKNTKTRLQYYPLFNQFLEQVENSVTYLEICNETKSYHLAHATPFKCATKHEQVHGEKVRGKRIKWFKETLRYWPDNVVKVSGHYHEILNLPDLIILDGDNKQDECIPALIITKTAHYLTTSN